MKSENSQITSYLELLASISTKLHIKKNEKCVLKNSSTTLKLKIFHYGKNVEEKYNEDLINLIRCNNHLLADLKILYGITYKDRLDQQQVKRKIINSFKEVSFEENNKRVAAYKSTVDINALYQLYQFKYEFNE